MRQSSKSWGMLTIIERNLEIFGDPADPAYFIFLQIERFHHPVLLVKYVVRHFGNVIIWKIYIFNIFCIVENFSREGFELISRQIYGIELRQFTKAPLRKLEKIISRQVQCLSNDLNSVNKCSKGGLLIWSRLLELVPIGSCISNRVLSLTASLSSFLLSEPIRLFDKSKCSSFFSPKSKSDRTFFNWLSLIEG